jgi:hypothetical protein
MPRRGIAIAIVALTALVAAPAAAQAVTPNPFYGVVGTYFPGPTDFSRIANAGGGTLRLQIDWRFTEPRPGVRDLYGTDILFGEAAQAGVTLLPDLFSVPKWLNRNRNRPPVYTARQRSEWQALLTDYATRYGTNGTFWTEHPELPKRPVTNWEIWNEPNLADSVGGKPSASQFVRLLSISKQALTAGDPNAKVIAGGLFPYRLTGGINMTKYMNAMYRVPGAASAFDGFGVHPFAAQPSGVLHWVRVARAIMSRHGDAAKPIWVSAFGWVTGGAGFRYTPLRTSFKQQAAKLTRAYSLLSANAASLGIASAIWFTYTDTHEARPIPHTKIRKDFITDRMGLFNLQLRPKPSWYAFAQSAGGTP